MIIGAGVRRPIPLGDELPEQSLTQALELAGEQ